MTDSADTLQDRRQLNPNADLVGIELVEHEGFRLELEDWRVGAEYMWDDGPLDERLEPDMLLPIPPRDPGEGPVYVGRRRVCNRWIYVATRNEDGTMLFRYELRADEDGGLRWLDALTFRELRSTNPEVDDEDDAAYLERGFLGDGSTTLWLSTIAIANLGVAWHFFGIAQRLPMVAVEELVASYDLWSPDRGLAAWSFDPLSGPPPAGQPNGPNRIARVFDPVVEVRRCTEEYILRRDRQLEYAMPIKGSDYYKTSTQRHMVKRTAVGCRALLDQDPDLDPDDIVAPHAVTWPSVKDLCFTESERALVEDVAGDVHGVDGFLEAEKIVWDYHWLRAERSATEVRLWLSSVPWHFVQRWTFERFERDPLPGHWVLATLARAMSRLDELVTGRQYLAWLTRRVVDANFSDPTPNLELMRVFLLPELKAAPGPDPIKMARAVPKAAFDFLVTGHRFIFGLPVEELRKHLAPLLPDHVAAGAFGKGLEAFRMSGDRRLFCNCVGRMMERFKEVTKVEIGGLFDRIDDLNMAIDVPAGPRADFRQLRFRLRLDTVGNLADDLLTVESELAASFNTTPGKTWFRRTLQRLTANDVGRVFAIMDVLINAREVWIACRDQDGTPSAAFKSAAAFLRSVYTYQPIKAAIDAPLPSPATQAVSKLHTVGPQDPRWLRRVMGSVTQRVGASLVGYLLSAIMLGYAIHDMVEKYEEGTDEELLISALVVVGEGASLASVLVYALYGSRAGAVGALIGVTVGLAVFVFQSLQPGEPEIAIRTCIFGSEYVGRDETLNDNARPWQACSGNSLHHFVPGRKHPDPMRGLATQLFAMTNLLHNFRMRLKTTDDDPLGVRIELQPGYVPRDGHFELRVELEWVVSIRWGAMTFEIDTVQHVYGMKLYPDTMSMPKDQGAILDEPGLALGVTDPGRLRVARDDTKGIALELHPEVGYGFEWRGEIVTDLTDIELHERYRLSSGLEGSGDARRLVVQLEHLEALGYLTDVVELSLECQLEADGVRFDVHRVAAIGSGRFAFALPESGGDLVPGSAVVRPHYEVHLPTDTVDVEGAPRRLDDEEREATWPRAPLDIHLRVVLAVEAWMGHDGYRLHARLTPNKAMVSNLRTGEPGVEMYVPVRQARLDYARNEDVENVYPEWHQHGESTDGGYAAIPMLRRFRGDFELDPALTPSPPNVAAIRSTDQLTHRFAVGFPFRDGTRWSGSVERGPEMLAKTHGSPALDTKLAKRKVLTRARVEARLVLGEPGPVGSMPCNLGTNDPVWLDQTLDALVTWKAGNRPTPGPTLPTSFAEAIDLCVPPR